MSKLALSALVRLYAELAGKVPLKHRDPERLRRDMWHVEKVIRMFAPGFDVATIKPKRHVRSNRQFPPGKRFRAALDVLRRAQEPLTAEEITRRLLAERGIESPSDWMLDKALPAIRASLRGHEGTAVRRVPGSRPARWTIV